MPPLLALTTLGNATQTGLFLFVPCPASKLLVATSGDLIARRRGSHSPRIQCDHSTQDPGIGLLQRYFHWQSFLDKTLQILCLYYDNPSWLGPFGCCDTNMDQCYITFFLSNLQKFLISQSVCPWQTFTAQPCVCGPGANPTVELLKGASLGQTLPLLANIRLGWICLPGTNTLV